VGPEEEEAVIRVLRSGWLTTGKEALAFEEEFSRFLAAGATGDRRTAALRAAAAAPGEHAAPGEQPDLPCLAVNSATSGLHLALEACGVKAGDLVLVPTYTFTSTAEVVRYLGAQPVFVDNAPDSFHIGPEALESVLEHLSREGRKAVAVMPVHYGGLPCDMEAVMAIARRYQLKVVEDAAHSFPSLVPEKVPGTFAGTLGSTFADMGSSFAGMGSSFAGMGSSFAGMGSSFAGTLGDAGVFSFYATKTLSTGEGGMVVCGNPELAKRISIMRSHGIDRSIFNRYTDAKASWYYEVMEAGFKYNLPDLLAAVGRVQLARAWDLLAMREEIARAYDRAFAGNPHFSLPPTGPGDARHLYPLRLNLETLTIGRDEFFAKIQKGGVGVSVHFIPLHTMPYYRKVTGHEQGDFPHALESFRREISLPIWPGMDAAMVNQVIDLVQSIAADYTA
jgi:dTDP-4-amino-4,6-dideoxygalactose transaminase